MCIITRCPANIAFTLKFTHSHRTLGKYCAMINTLKKFRCKGRNKTLVLIYMCVCVRFCNQFSQQIEPTRLQVVYQTRYTFTDKPQTPMQIHNNKINFNPWFFFLIELNVRHLNSWWVQHLQKVNKTNISNIKCLRSNKYMQMIYQLQWATYSFNWMFVNDL